MRENRASRTSARGRYRRRVVTVSLLAVATPLVVAESGHAAPSARPEIQVLSNRADLVSGGDALVQVQLPKPADAQDVKVSLNGRDITDRFEIRPNGRYQGLVTGLREGTNQLTARMARGASDHGAKLTITNYSKQGPIFAGKQVQPWICETEKYGLGPATGPACVAPSRHDFFYKSTDTNQFEAYNPESPPADDLIATTTTDQGKTVPYIVRRERGVIDRGIYDIAVLIDPNKAWQPWAPQDAWNGKLHWLFDGGSRPTHQQGGVGIPDVLNDTALSPGFAVASSTLHIGQNNVNDVVMAEALMMIKEHFIETYGPVRYTMAQGGSGGAAAQYGIADNYPGLLDGIIPEFGVPDMWSWAAVDLADCHQLGRYFNEASPKLWTDPSDRAAVTGTFVGAFWCGGPGHLGAGPRFDPTFGCTWLSPEPDWIYHPQTNPTGVRCTNQDYMAPVFGYRSSDGFANRPLDNVGIQYGLTPLKSGQITPEQFVDLNVNVGGRDIDYNWTPQRTEADPEALRAMYRSSRVTYGRGLAKVPIMDLRAFDASDIHAKVHTQVMRDRLIAANGHAKNYVAWESFECEILCDGGPSGKYQEMFTAAFATLDEWLAGIEADTSSAPLEVKVLRHKPSEAKDTCWENGQPGAECLPTHQMPRIVAGGPVANNIIKCQLKPIDWSDYRPVEFTEGQKQQLRDAFRTGVCDWTKSGVEQQPPAGVWQSFSNTTGGHPLGPHQSRVA